MRSIEDTAVYRQIADSIEEWWKRALDSDVEIDETYPVWIDPEKYYALRSEDSGHYTESEVMVSAEVDRSIYTHEVRVDPGIDTEDIIVRPTHYSDVPEFDRFQSTVLSDHAKQFVDDVNRQISATDLENGVVREHIYVPVKRGSISYLFDTTKVSRDEAIATVVNGEPWICDGSATLDDIDREYDLLTPYRSEDSDMFEIAIEIDDQTVTQMKLGYEVRVTDERREAGLLQDEMERRKRQAATEIQNIPNQPQERNLHRHSENRKSHSDPVGKRFLYYEGVYMDPTMFN